MKRVIRTINCITEPSPTVTETVTLAPTLQATVTPEELLCLDSVESVDFIGATYVYDGKTMLCNAYGEFEQRSNSNRDFITLEFSRSENSPLSGDSRSFDFGLMYYVARWYDPVLAHFTSADTVIPNAGNSGDWNRYAYVLYNPANFSDPTGHSSFGDNYDPADPDSWLGQDFELYQWLVIHPYYGALFEDTSCEEMSGNVELVDQLNYEIQQLYLEQGIDLGNIAEQIEENPLSFTAVINTEHGAYFAGVSTANWNYEPYQVFLYELFIESGNSEIILGFSQSAEDIGIQYESNYLAALMEEHPDVLRKAMIKYEQMLQARQLSWGDIFKDYLDDMLDNAFLFGLK